MRFRIEKKELERLLDVPSRIVAKNNAIQALGMFLLELSGSDLCVTASDGDIRVKSTSLVEGLEDGILCVDARRMRDLSGAVRDGQVEFSSDGMDVVLSSVGGHCRLVMPSFGASDYPIEPPVAGDSLVLPSEVLSGMLSSVSFAVASSELRPVLCCVCMKIGGGLLSLAASDGTVLSKSERAMESPFERTALIPSASVSLLSRALSSGGDVSVTLSDRRAMFVCGGVTMSCALQEGRFPNIDSIIPACSGGRTDVSRQQLLGTLRTVMSCSDSVSNLVVLDLKGDTMTLRCEDRMLCTSAVDVVQCSGGADVVVGVNGMNLGLLLRNLKSDKLYVDATSPSRPVVFRQSCGEGFDVTAVVMPCLIDN